MKNLITAFCLFLFAFNCNAQDTIKIADFENFNNTSWTGKLTYKDYQSGEQTSIETTM
jgi:hypothetical protein